MFEAMNIAYGESEKRGYIKLNAITLAFTFGFVVFLVLALTAIAVVPPILNVLGLGSAAQWLFSLARWPAVVAVGSVVSGWGVAQYPWLLVDEVRIADAGGATATLQALLVAVGLAVVVVLPPLAYLLRLTQSEEWSRH